MSLKPQTLLMLLIVAFVQLVSCNEESKQVELVPVTIGITSFVGEAASFVADEKGYFRENGLDVRLHVNRDGSESIRQLLAGELDMAHVAETPIFFSLLNPDYFTGEKKGNLQILANMMNANKIQRVLARRAAGIETPGDIRGKRVALAGGTQLEYLLDSFLLEHQININEIDTLHMSVTDQVEAIRDGHIDVAFVWEPQAALIEYQSGNAVVELPTNLTYSTLWLATVLDSFAENKPDVVTAYLKSIRQAQQFIHGNREWTVNLLSDRTSASPEIFRDVMNQIDFNLSLSERMLNLLEEQQRWILDHNVADSVDVYEMINFRFMEDVYPEGITLYR